MIGGLQPCSFIDFPGHLAAVVFTRGCNLRCKYCHNPDLCSSSAPTTMSKQDLLRFLETRKGRLTGVVITGGEPTLHKDLLQLLSDIRFLGLSVKLDTNGTRPMVVRELIRNRLIDYAAVDIKVAPGVSSKNLCGSKNQAEAAMETLKTLVVAGIPCEARTTVIDKEHSLANLKTIAHALSEAGVKTWRLQPVNSVRVLDPFAILIPPNRHVLAEAVNTATAVGIDASIRGAQFV